MRGHRAGPSSSVGSQAPFFADRRPYTDTWSSVKRYVWNSEKKTVCNRTAFNWIQLLVFYIVFLIVIFGLTTAILAGITHYIRDNYSRPLLSKSGILDNDVPGMGFAPRIRKGGAPLIWYTVRGRQSDTNMKPKTYVTEIKQYLREHASSQGSEYHYENCSGMSRAPSGKLCIFDSDSLGPCGTPDYGYPEKKPCIYLRINRLDSWIPQYYSLSDIPKNIPTDLKEAMEKSPTMDMVWVKCAGWRPFDQQHLGDLEYYPAQGFPGYYFPYTGQKGYISPLVAIKLNNIKPGFFVTIVCQLYAKNIGADSFHMTVNVYLALDP